MEVLSLNITQIKLENFTVFKNIEIHFPDNDGNEYLSMHDVEDKFPYEVLHPQHGIEILAGISFGSKTKYRKSKSKRIIRIYRKRRNYIA